MPLDAETQLRRQSRHCRCPNPVRAGPLSFRWHEARTQPAILFRARNQYIGRDLKIKPEKFTLSDQIGHRFSVIAPLLQTPEGIGLRWLKLLMRARHQLGA